MWSARSILPTLLFLHLSGVAHACEPMPFEAPILPLFHEDDDIFIGTLIDYEIAPDPHGLTVNGVARLTYKVDEVLKGEFGEQVQLSWGGQIHSGLPESYIQTWESEIIGVRATDIDGFLVPFEPEGKPGMVPKPSHPPFLKEIAFLALHPCDNVGQLPATLKNIETVKNWIATGEKVPYGEIDWFDKTRINVPAREYHEPRSLRNESKEVLDQLPALPNLASWQWLLLGVLTLLLFATSFFTWKARRS